MYAGGVNFRGEKKVAVLWLTAAVVVDPVTEKQRRGEELESPAALPRFLVFPSVLDVQTEKGKNAAVARKNRVTVKMLMFLRGFMLTCGSTDFQVLTFENLKKINN